MTIGGVAVIAIAVAFMAVTQIGVAQNANFLQSVDNVANDAIKLTHDYQAEEGKWRHKQYDNTTMAGIIDKFDPRYQSLIDRANSLNPPEKYKSAIDFLTKAIQTEKDSNDHLKNALLNNDRSEYDVSVNLLAKSYAYSGDFDAAIRAAGT